MTAIKRLVSSKWFWAVVVGKYIVSAFILAYIVSPKGSITP